MCKYPAGGHCRTRVHLRAHSRNLCDGNMDSDPFCVWGPSGTFSVQFFRPHTLLETQAWIHSLCMLLAGLSVVLLADQFNAYCKLVTDCKILYKKYVELFEAVGSVDVGPHTYTHIHTRTHARTHFFVSNSSSFFERPPPVLFGCF